MNSKLDLKDAEEHTKESLEKVAELRKNLKVATVAEKVPVEVKIYSAQALAMTYPTQQGPKISVNMLPFAVMKDYKPEYEQIRDYFSKFWDIMLDCDENIIISSIYQNKPDIKATLAKAMKNYPDYLELISYSFKEQGLNLEEHIRQLEKDAKKTRQNLEKTITEIKNSYKSADIPTVLAHEVDHADMMNTTMYKELLSTQMTVITLGYGMANIKERADMEEELLKKRSEALTLMETRALIYTFMGPDTSRLKTMPEWLAQQAIIGHNTQYTNKEFLDRIANSIITKEQLKGRINKATEDYIIKSVGIQTDQEKPLSGKISPGKIDYKKANKILYEEMPAWQKKFADNSAKAAPILIKTLAEKPGRFERARKAKTLDEYLRMLQRKR